jgi:hypothetical protein
MKKTFKKSDYKHKQWFRANISGEECVGRVSICKESGDIYLCQNECDGSSAPDKLGFRCSWIINNGTPSNLKVHDVKDLILLPRKPAAYKSPIELPDIGDYRARITHDGETVKVGCTLVPRELYLEVGRLAGWIE